MGIVNSNVVVDIGTLELRGIPPAHRFRVARAFERELLRLLQADPVGRTPSRAIASSASIANPTAAPDDLGRVVAQAVYQGMQGDSG